MDDMARVEWAGDEQVVHLPAGYGFDAAEVRVTREGNRIVLEAAEGDGPGWSDDELQRIAREGLASGPDVPFDVDAIKRKARALWTAEQRR